MKKGIIVQARMGSHRLPGKSMEPISGCPLIGHVLERVKKVSPLTDIILATSTEPGDDILAETALSYNVFVFRGEEENVQRRFYDAATAHKLDVIIRVTGDNPLIEPALIELLVQSWDAEQCDYIGFRDCILGIGSELFTMQSFSRAVALSATAYDREHVTPPYYRQSQFFKTRFLTPPHPFQDKDERLTVDIGSDLEYVKHIYECYCRNGIVDLKEVLADSITKRKNMKKRGR